jgi:hypothetical protein
MTTLVFKDGSEPTSIVTGLFYDSVDSFSIELKVNNDYPITHINGDQLYITIDRYSSKDNDGNSGPSLSTFRSYPLDINNILTGNGTITVTKTTQELSDIITGLTPQHKIILQKTLDKSKNDGALTYDFSTIYSVVAKVYITLSGTKYKAVSPPFRYVPEAPVLSDFNIYQSTDSSALHIENLTVSNCTRFEHYPASISLLADAIEKGNDDNDDTDIILGKVNVEQNNAYNANTSTITPIYNLLHNVLHNEIVPLTHSKYKISMTDTSEGILNTSTNIDLIVHSNAMTKPSVELALASQSINVLYLRRCPKILNVTPYDAVNNSGSNDSPNMQIMTVILDTENIWEEGYEPDSIQFSLTTQNPAAPSVTWTFNTSTPLPYTASGVYNIRLDQMIYIESTDTSDTATHKLENNPSKYELKVTAEWEEIREFRFSDWEDDVIFTQELPPVVNVSAYNTWQPQSLFSSQNIASDDTVMPSLGITLRILKNSMFNGSTQSSLDDPAKTKLRIQYKRVSGSSWIDVPSGYVSQPNNDDTGNELLRIGANDSFNSTPASNLTGGLVNIPPVVGTYNDNKIGTLQNPIFVYLANMASIYEESISDPLLFRVRIETTVSGYNALSSDYIEIAAPLYSIRKPLEYSWSTGSDLEPYMDFNGPYLVLPMLAGDNDVNNVQSIYYAGESVSWVTPSIPPSRTYDEGYPNNPKYLVTLGTNAVYNVTYKYTDPNNNGVQLSSRINGNYTAPCQGLPVASDYSIGDIGSNYIYNAVADTLEFDFTMAALTVSGSPATTRIDGVELRIKFENGSYVNSSIPIKTFYNYSGAGITKYTSGNQSINIGDLDLIVNDNYLLEFRPFRDNLVNTTGEFLYPTTDEWYFIEFTYLERPEVRVLYSWGPQDGGKQPYMDFTHTPNHIVIPLQAGHTKNYAGATITWLKNDYLNIEYGDEPSSVDIGASDTYASFPVTNGKAVIYQVTYKYTVPSGEAVLGEISGEFTANCQGMPSAGDFTQSSAVNLNNDPVYIQDDLLLVFKLDTFETVVDTLTQTFSDHRIDGVVVFATDENEEEPLTYIATFDNNLINANNGECIINIATITDNPFSIPGKTYKLIFKAYRDRRVARMDAAFNSDDFIISSTVTSTVNFVLLDNPMASVYDDQVQNTFNVISVSDVITSTFPADNNGEKDQFTISWPPSIINDVTEYLIYKVTLAAGSVPESSTLKHTKPAVTYPATGLYTYSDDIPDESQIIVYDIQKSYMGRLSASTRISFPVSKLKVKPAEIRILKQDDSNIYAQLLDAVVDIHEEHKLLDIMVKADRGTGNERYFPFTLNGGKKNSIGLENYLTIPQLYNLGQVIILEQQFQVEWSFAVNGTVSPKNLDTFYGSPAEIVYATRPSISLKDENNINGNMFTYNGKPALRLKLNASMGQGASQGYATPSLTSVIILLAQDTTTSGQTIQTHGTNNILAFYPLSGSNLMRNTSYSAVGDFKNIALPLTLANFADTSAGTTFGLQLGDLTIDDNSFLIFPSNSGYFQGLEVNMMILVSNDYGIDSYTASFTF